jgi:hypothetical protein
MKKIIYVLFLVVMAGIYSCSGVTDAVTNAQKLQWKLGNVSNMRVSGVDITKVSSMTQINALDLLKITNDFASGKLPASFTLNLLAKNPEKSGGTQNSTDVIRSVKWRLLVDNKETINGNVSGPITIPGVGQTSTIPVSMSLDLLQIFQNEGMQNLISLALGMGGSQGSAARLSLKIQPTIDTFLGSITYPGEITVIDKEFRSK